KPLDPFVVAIGRPQQPDDGSCIKQDISHPDVASACLPSPRALWIAGAATARRTSRQDGALAHLPSAAAARCRARGPGSLSDRALCNIASERVVFWSSGAPR